MPPELITFQPCKDILQNPHDGATSIIGLLTRMEAFALRDPDAEPGEEDGPNYIFEPFKIVAVWKKTDSETLTRFQLKLSAEAPDGRRTDWSDGENVEMTSMYFATLHYMPPLGARLLGVLNVVVSVRDDPGQEWSEAGRYPILLEIPTSPKEALAETPSSV